MSDLDTHLELSSKIKWVALIVEQQITGGFVENVVRPHAIVVEKPQVEPNEELEMFVHIVMQLNPLEPTPLKLHHNGLNKLSCGT